MSLTAKTLRERFIYDPLTGLFTRRVDAGRNGRWKAGSAAGSLREDGYVVLSIDRKIFKASRLAVLYMTGKWPADEVDHENTINSDNRWENLRDATRTVNAQNQRAARRNSKSGLRGVYWHKRVGKWCSNIGVGKKTVHIGYFEHAIDGHLAYVEKKRELHPGNTL